MGKDPYDDALLADLVTHAQRGDEGSFGSLYEALYPTVWAYVSRRQRQRQDAEDLVARAFHQFLQSLDSYDLRRGGVRVFIISIARNLLIDDARARRPRVSIDDIVLKHAETPLSVLLQAEELAALRREVDRLAPSEQELLLLRFGDGLQYGEIGQLLRVQEDAIKQRFSRLLRRLRVDFAAAMERPVPR